MALKSRENVSFLQEPMALIFVINSYLNDSAFRAVKGMQSPKQGMWKGYNLSIEGIRKGYFFRGKWYKKG